MELAQAFVRLRVDPSRVAADTSRGIEQGAAAAGTARAGKTAAKSFSSSFTGGLKKQLPAFARAGDEAGASYKARLGAQLGAAVGMLGKFGAVAVAGIGIASVKMATDFNSSMKLIQTQAGGSARDVAYLSKQVLRLGTYAEQSPKQLADAMFHLKSVGLSNVQAMRALRTSSDLAAVGQANLEDTANALAGAWRSGIRGATNFRQAAATVNAIIGAGNMRMRDFVAALGTGILPAAKTFGLSLRQVGAALALMTDEGIPAQAAATRLRMAFSLLGAPSKAAEGQLTKIGLSGLKLGEAMRSKGGIIAAVALLKKHLDASGLSATQQAALLSRAFGGGRQSAAILTLVNNLDVLRRKQEQINKSMGRFGPAVAAQRRTASAQFALLKSSLEVLAIRLGTKLLPIVVKAVHWLGNMNHLIPVLVTGFGLLTAATIAWGIAFITATGGIPLAIGAVTAEIILLATHWKQVWQWVSSHWRTLIAVIGVVMPPLALIIATLRVITQHWRGIRDAAVTAFRIIAGAAVTAWNWLVAGWHVVVHAAENAWHAIVHAAENVWHAIMAVWHSKALQLVFAGIATAARIAWDIVSGVALLAWWIIYHGFIKPLATVFGWLWRNVVAPIARWAWNQIVGDVRSAWRIIHPILTGIGTAAKWVWDHIASWAQTAWHVITPIFRSGTSIAKAAFRGLWTVISTIFGWVINAAARAFGWLPGLGPKLKDAARAFNRFRDQVNAALNGLHNKNIHVAVSLQKFHPGQVLGGRVAAATSGGQVRGPGTGTSDTAGLFALSNREWVIRANSASMYGMAAMHAVNEGRAVIHYASGGPVGKGVTVQPSIPSAAQINAVITAPYMAILRSYAHQVETSIRDAIRNALSGGFTSGAARFGGSAAAKAFARRLLPSYGWGPGQWLPLLYLWNQESGWNPYAVNASSGAYGIPQALGHGHPFALGDYANQVRWGLGYIHGRYGSPAAAWAHERAFNWYHGGLSAVFTKPTVIGVGDGGAEQVDVTPLRVRRNGHTYTGEVHFHFHGPVASREQAKDMVEAAYNALVREGRIP